MSVALATFVTRERKSSSPKIAPPSPAIRLVFAAAAFLLTFKNFVSNRRFKINQGGKKYVRNKYAHWL